MPRFFTEQITEKQAFITGDDARHIVKSLRMSVGESLVICDGKGYEYDCTIVAVGEEVLLDILESRPSETEPSIRLHLYQAMPKGEKMEFIIQKAVELGAYDITPVLTSRCVSRPDTKSMEKKLIRYQKIATEAAKQCGRGILPTVRPMMSLESALKEQKNFDNSIFFYECGGEPLQKLILEGQTDIGIMVGSEGGFSEAEAEAAVCAGMKTATLGKRILRCETAPIAAAAIIFNLTGNM